MRILLPILICITTGFSQENLDINQLVRPVERHVDFVTEIEPLFNRSCMKCHGDKNPKSNYRMTSRKLALEGGELGVAIISGNSEKSPLVHYISHLVEDMDMPPEGKAPTLNQKEVALVRGWIDQGAVWPDHKTKIMIAPLIRWIEIDGNSAAFKQHWGITDGFTAGIEKLAVTGKTSSGSLVELNGRYIDSEKDHLTQLRIEKPGLGYIETGYESWREFGLANGGFMVGAKSTPFSLNKSPQVDLKRFWFSGGLLKKDSSGLNFSYDRLWSDGQLATQQWGTVPLADFETRAIYPSVNSVEDALHRISLDAWHEIGETKIEDSLSIEIGDSSSIRNHVDYFNFPEEGNLPDYISQIDNSQDFKRGANSLRFTRRLRDWWHVSLGHHFAKFDGGGSLNVISMFPNNPGEAPWQGDRSNSIRTKQRSHFINATTLINPVKSLSFSGGVQGESSRQQGIASGLSLGTSPLRFASGLDTSSIEANVHISYSGIKNTVLTAGTRLRSEQSDHREESHIDNDWGADGFMRETDENGRLVQNRFGFIWSPNIKWLFRGGYRWRNSESRFKHPIDVDLFNKQNSGYPAFINFRQDRGDVVDLGLTWRGYSKWIPSLRWEQYSTDYKLSTSNFDDARDELSRSGDRLLSGKHKSDVFSFSYKSSLFPKVVMSTSLGYTDTWSGTIENKQIGLQPYAGDVWFYVDQLNYIINPDTDITLSWSYHHASYENPNLPQAIAYGLEAERHGVKCGVRHRVGQKAVLNLEYGWFSNNEPSSNSINNYKAHMILATLRVDLD
ncbi:MAG: c-type cytochrome domain-containing protein [Verrucomicrobiota bacterium]|nr:c-type cytochrome domain-containing protein [Verrucomicrobiota bacterium]